MLVVKLKDRAVANDYNLMWTHSTSNTTYCGSRSTAESACRSKSNFLARETKKKLGKFCYYIIVDRPTCILEVPSERQSSQDSLGSKKVSYRCKWDAVCFLQVQVKTWCFKMLFSPRKEDTRGWNKNQMMLSQLCACAQLRGRYRVVTHISDRVQSTTPVQCVQSSDCIRPLSNLVYKYKVW